MKLSTRLAAAVLAVTLPAAAVAGCGAEKKRTIKAELASAGDNLKASKALSLSLRFDDHDGSLGKAAAAEDGGKLSTASSSLLKGGITYTVDPAGNKTLRDLRTDDTSEQALKRSIKDVNVALVIRSDKAAVGELRLVAGTLYAHVDLKEINRLATSAGGDPIDGGLDDMSSGDPSLKRAVADVRAGKWIKVPLLDYIDKLKDLAKSFSDMGAPVEPSPSTAARPDFADMGDRLYNAVKPYVKVTDANNSSSDRVLDVSVQVRPALKAALAVMKSMSELPFADALKDLDPSEIDKNVADGSAHGTIRLSDGHLTQLAIDLESLRTLDPDPGKTSLKGSSVVLDVDDSAGQVSAPTNVSSFNIGDLLDSLLSGAQQA
ncbi:MAG: hypothetical protein JWM40_1319 [Frankiales bacterium]|nr:hypothetical protein [Frankiales bacterium]